jgi:signal transduction histidine kinase
MMRSILEKLTPFNPAESSLTRVLAQLRWIVPLTFSVTGLLYVLFESFFQHSHEVPHTRGQILFSVSLLSVLGPTLAYAGLTWVLQGAIRMETAERALRRQNRHLATLEEIARVANLSLEPDQVLSRSLDSLLHLIGLEIGAIWLRQNDHLVLKVSRGVSPEFLVQEQNYPLDKCLCGYSVEQGRLLTLDDVPTARTDVQAPAHCESFEAALTVPIRSSDKVMGVLEIASQTPREFDSSEIEMLSTIGHQVGLALEKAQLHRQLRELNQELESLVAARTGELMATQEELARKAARLQELLVRVRQVEEETRACIANDLHDSVRQLIVGALFEAQAIREAIRSRPENAARELDSLEEILRRIETEMRAAIYSLRPVTLDAHGLTSALHECVATFERTAGIPCALQVQGTPRRFEDAAELAAFRIVQEALNNVVAHSGASRASVAVLFETEKLDIQVRDNGHGFDPKGYANGSRGQLGLLGMQERAQSSGGTLRVHSGNGDGTCIRLTLPLEKVDTWIPYALSS